MLMTLHRRRMRRFLLVGWWDLRRASGVVF
jgi:hypothetical protein